MVDIAINPEEAGEADIKKWKWYYEHTTGQDEISFTPDKIKDVKVLYIVCKAFTSSTFSVNPYT